MFNVPNCRRLLMFDVSNCRQRVRVVARRALPATERGRYFWSGQYYIPLLISRSATLLLLVVASCRCVVGSGHRRIGCSGRYRESARGKEGTTCHRHHHQACHNTRQSDCRERLRLTSPASVSWAVIEQGTPNSFRTPPTFWGEAS